jgi:hypothetical protein
VMSPCVEFEDCASLRIASTFVRVFV